MEQYFLVEISTFSTFHIYYYTSTDCQPEIQHVLTDCRL